jgi:energy-converting hydrogenase B subunit D
VTELQAAILLLVSAGGAGVVFTHDPLRQAIAIGFYGLLLALMFLLFQAPDVSLSQIVVGAVALPLMMLLAIAKVRRDAEERKRKNEKTH